MTLNVEKGRNEVDLVYRLFDQLQFDFDRRPCYQEEFGGNINRAETL
jgi:hypothetical protein